MAGGQQRSRHSGHAERRQGEHAKSEEPAAVRWRTEVGGPDVPGQEAAQTLRRNHSLL